VDDAARYGAPPITLPAERDGERVTLSVTDQGDDIAAAERVLAPFYRLAKTRTPGAAAGGFGLGLTLASRVAQSHQGAITIGPAETINGTGHGYRVTLTLPTEPAGVR
jgi:signal transduction histidine kinase